MLEITGRLENWVSLGNTYVGDIYDDSRKRFPDGRTVRTSTVVRVEGKYVHTRNSIYELGEPAK